MMVSSSSIILKDLCKWGKDHLLCPYEPMLVQNDKSGLCAFQELPGWKIYFLKPFNILYYYFAIVYFLFSKIELVISVQEWLKLSI